MNRAKSLIAVGIILCVLLSSLTPFILPGTARAQPADSAWPMFGQNPQRTGRSPYSGPEVPYQKWRFTTGGSVYSSPAIGADGTIYVGSADNNLYALNPDGSQKWRFTTEGSVYSSPAIGADGTIYVGSDDGNLYAINPDGSEKWRYITDESVKSSPAIGPDGTIYVGSADNNLYAINPDGSEKWSFTTGAWVYSSPAIGADGTIYVGSWDDNLYAINPDGGEKWSFTTQSRSGAWSVQISSSPAVGEGGTIYVGSHYNDLYAINPDGSEKWRFTTEGSVYSSPAIGADGTIYVGSDDGNLYAINPDGSEKWRYITDESVKSSPAIGPDGTIYVGSHDNSLHAVDPDGTVKWRFTTGAWVYSSPAIGADGTIYVGSRDCNLYAFTEAPDYTLAVSSTTGGSVAEPGEGQFTRVGGSVVKLVAAPDEGCWFVNWTGDVDTIADVYAAATTITMRGDYAITANFAEIQEQCDLTISSTAGGSVTEPGEGTFTYDGGTTVELVAQPDEGYRFVNWTGDVYTVDNVYAPTTTITMYGDFSITANFVEMGPWPMFGQNPQRTGQSPYTGPEIPYLKWRFTTEGSVYSSPAIGADGTIYVGSMDNKLYAINPDGSQKWSFTTWERVWSSPAIGADGTIYVGSGWGLYALNPDGSEKWRFMTGWTVWSSPAIGADGTIYVGSYDGNLYAINPDGSQKWSFTTGDAIRSSPAIGADGTIYVGSHDNNLYALNPDGSQQWRFTTGYYVDSSPAIGADGTIYVGSRDKNLYALNPDGSQQWSFTTGGSVESSPAIGPDGTIYVGSGDNNLHAIDPDGSQQWSFTTGGSVYSSPAIGADGTIYFGSNDSNLYALNPDGSEKWSFTTGAWVYSSPAIGADGTIYVGSHDNNLYAIKEAPEYDLTVSSTAGGSVTDPGEGGFIHAAGTVVDLMAVPDEGYWFVNWTGDVDTIADVYAATTTITMRDDHAITANFEAIQEQCDLTIFSTAGGSVTEPGEGTFTYDGGTTIELAAQPDEGYWFANWTGDLYTVDDVYARTTSITMYGDFSITANFVEMGPWPMFGQNAQRTGQSPYTGPEIPYLQWRFTTGDNVLSSPAVGADGTIYVGSWDDNLYALNPDGTVKWSFTTKSRSGAWWVWISSSPTIGEGGTIYFGSRYNNLYAINPDGSEKWRYITDESVKSSPAIGPDGTIYVGSGDNNLHAIDPDGSEKWSFTTGGSVYSSPAIGPDGTIYVGSDDGNLYAINSDGSEKWRYITDESVKSSPAIGPDGTIYVGSHDNNLHAIDPDGSEKWSFTTGGSVYSSPAIGPDGTIYVGSDDGNLYAINSDGSEKWRYITDESVKSSPAIGADGTVYVGSYDNNLYALNPDGSEKWRLTTGEWISSSPAIGADGTIYVGSWDNNLYAITEAPEDYVMVWLVAPSAGATNVDRTNVGFTWNALGDIDSFDFVLSANADLSEPIETEEELAITAYTSTATLDYEITYYWQVTAWHDGNVVGQSDIASFTTMAEPPPPPDVGVKAGDWIKSEYEITGWPAGQPYPEWLKLEFLTVEGTSANVRVTMRMSDGTEETDTMPLHIGSGAEAPGLSGGVIPANLTTGDSVYMTGYGWLTLEGETTRNYAGANRIVVHAGFSQYGVQLTYYWDKQTGVMVEASTTHGDVVATARATETNMWKADPTKTRCFIATAAYGTPMAEEIQVLREFRDGYLLTNRPGRAFVELYYRVSPPVAEFITEHPELKPVVRVGLMPAVALSTLVVNTTATEKATVVGLVSLISLAMALLETRRRGRGPEHA